MDSSQISLTILTLTLRSGASDHGLLLFMHIDHIGLLLPNNKNCCEDRDIKIGSQHVLNVVFSHSIRHFADMLRDSLLF